jgi:hypothetical protein
MTTTTQQAREHPSYGLARDLLLGGANIAACQAQGIPADVASAAFGEIMHDPQLRHEMQAEQQSRRTRPTQLASASQQPPAPQYENVARFFARGMPDPPRPDLGHRADGFGMFYRGKVNVVLGPPESGKTLALQCVALDVLADHGRVLHVDLDHNGLELTLQRYAALAGHADTTIQALSDQDRFRYAQPDDPAALDAIIADMTTWQPDLVIVDSIGELIPLYGRDSNSADDYSAVHRHVLTALANTGAAVVGVDHEAKNRESARYGSTGTMAKKRAVDGLMLRSNIRQPFTPDSGGVAALTIVKDRPGGARAASPRGDDEPCYAMFELSDTWQFRPVEGNTAQHIADSKLDADIDALRAVGLGPDAPVRQVRGRMHWGTDRVNRALRAFREQAQKNDPGNVPIPLGTIYGDPSNE